MTLPELKALHDALEAVYRAAEHTVEQRHLNLVHLHRAELAAHIAGIETLPPEADGSWMAGVVTNLEPPAFTPYRGVSTLDLSESR